MDTHPNNPENLKEEFAFRLSLLRLLTEPHASERGPANEPRQLEELSVLLGKRPARSV